jgi:predicted amidophosphoribosyltransferase
MEPCETCLASMPWTIEGGCSLCGMDLAGADNPCPNCRDGVTSIDGVTALGHWSGPLRIWLSGLKYGGDSRLSRWPADCLFSIWKNYYPGLTVVPVPPRRAKLHIEGRDTVALIVRQMQALGVPIGRYLKRRGNKTQKSLNRKERLEGKALRYAVKKTVQGLPEELVVLDDVMTTGATLSSCATVLKDRGVKRVYGIVMCRD